MVKERTKRWYEATVRIARKYAWFVEHNTCGIAKIERNDINYWRERLFTKFITYLLPTCFIALIPGVIMSFKSGLIFIAYADILSVFLIAAVSLNVRLSLVFRKVFVAMTLYLLSIILIIVLSLLGPGIVYLLALSVLVTVIFPRNHGYWTVGANLLICICCALIIHFKLFDSPLTKDYSLGTWIAVSSNVVFLSWVMVILIGSTIRGFEKVIKKELLLKSKLEGEIIKGNKNNALLAESESHYKSLFYNNPSPMWILDKESLMFMQVNAAAIEQYGYTNEEFVSMNIMNIKMEEDEEQLHKDIEQNEITGVPARFITRHCRRNQQQFYAAVTFNSFLFNGKQSTLVISQDISEQMTYIQAIEKQNELFREISWMQSHRVRAPLANILGLVQLFNENDTCKEELIQGIQLSARQLDEVIKDVVDKSWSAITLLPPILQAS